VLEKVFKKFNIEIAYDSLGKFRDLLGNLKDKIDEMEKSGIYKILCAICRAFYIGQSKRRIGIRYEDHLEEPNQLSYKTTLENIVF
jgi:hypothetical protein